MSGTQGGSDEERWTPPIGPIDPEHPECAAVIAEVWTLLDGECTVETRDRLRQHLAECPTCLRHYGVEERVKNLIATKCSGERAPESLRERLRIQISQTTIIRGGLTLTTLASDDEPPGFCEEVRAVRR